MGPLLVGIDVGTSKIKICVFDHGGQLIRQMSKDSVVLSPAEGHMEMNLKDLMATIITLLKEVISGYETHIEAIGFSVTSPTLVLLDKELNPVRPGILYLDNRSSKEVSLYVEALGGKESYFSRIGNNPSPSTCTVGTINWIRKNELETWARTYKIGYLNTFLAAQFTGELAIDPTIASFSGLLDVGKPEHWDEELIKISEIDPSLLPDIRSSVHKVGNLQRNIAKATGLKSGIPVAIGSADTAAASFALGLKQHGDVFQSMGTSEVLTFCLSEPEFDQAYMNRSHVIPGLWLAHGAMSTTGAAIEWIKDKIFPEFENVYNMEKEALNAGPGANGLIFLPYLLGERSPVFDPNACGTFFGLNLKTDRGSVIRSVYEGAAYGIRQLYSIAQEKWNIEADFIRCVGGATQSPLALQVRADILNVQYKSMEVDYASSLGAALLGGIAANLYESIDEVPNCNTFSKCVYPNSENIKIYDNCFEIYKNLYPNLRHLMHKRRRGSL